MRERIYDSYRSAHGLQEVTAVQTELASRQPYLDALVTRHFPSDRGAEILDLGCGSGTVLHVAKRRGYNRLVGVDRSAEQVAAAMKLGELDVREGDLMETLQSTAGSSKDVIISFDVIEHFTSSELISFVDEVRRVLRPRGRWIVHTINAESPLFGRIRYGDLTHEQAFTAKSIRQLLHASGFTQVHCYEDTPVVHGAISFVRRVGWSLVREALRAYIAIETGSVDRNIILSQNFLTVAVK